MLRNRNLTRTLISIMLGIIFVAFGLILPTATAEAKADPKLSASSVTIAYGGKQTIKLKNGKGTWSIDGDDVIKIKKKTKTQMPL